MAEVVFSDSAAGSLAIAMGGKPIGGAVSVAMLSSDGKRPKRKVLREACRRAEERERRGWEEAQPLSGSRRDILSFPLALGFGELDEEAVGPKREAAIARLMSVYPQVGREAARGLLDTARNSLAELRRRVQGGETVRVWGSGLPDDACGLCWLADQLRALGPDALQVTLVRLPQLDEQPDGSLLRYAGWGEVEPWRWGRLAAAGEALPRAVLRAMADHWKQLQRENAPLRAVLNGDLVSVPETFYDPWIRQELEAMGGVFQEAQVVGRVLCHHGRGLSDGWIALRIEAFVQEGWLEAVSEPEPGDPCYHRLLRKRESA